MNETQNMEYGIENKAGRILNFEFGIFAHILYSIFLIPFCLLLFIPAPADAALLQRPPNNLNLVGYWPFDEGTGSIAKDASGGGLNGTLAGSPLPGWTVGKINNGLSFTGVIGQYVNLTSKSDLNASTFTYCVWVNTTTAAGAIILSGLVGPNNGGPIFYVEPGTGKIGFDAQGQHATLKTATTITSGAWNHVCLTRDGSGNYAVYLQGALVFTKTDAFTINAGVTLVLGSVPASNQPSAVSSFDDLRIYSRTLSAADIARIYTAGRSEQASSQPTLINSGLIGYWTFDGKTLTSNVADQSGGSNTGNLVNFTSTSSALTAGRIGQALTFSGTNQYVNMGNTLDQTGATAFSIGMWFKSTAGGATVYTMVSKSSISNPFLGFQFGFNVITGTAPNAGKVGVVFVATPGVTIMRRETTTAYNDGNWHYALFTYNGSKTRAGIQIYVDGNLASMEDSDSTAFSGSMSNSTNFEIGARDGANQPFKGTLDDVRIYNRALTAQEIKALYSSGASIGVSPNAVQATTASPNLVGYWTFNALDTSWITGTTLDKSGSGNTGNLINMSTTSSPVAGKVGQALNFNGTNQSVVIGSFTPANAITFSAWVKFTSLPSSGTGVEMIASAGSTAGVEGTDFSAVNSSGVMQIRLGINNNSTAQYRQWAVTVPSPVISTGTWYHVVLTQASVSATPGMYINGVPQSVSLIVSNGGSPARTTDTLAIGQYGGSSTLFFPGTIDDVRIYNVALSAQQVLQLYNSTR
jgi:hypothetical protein